MLAFSLRLSLAGAALAACLACLPLALAAQPDFGDNTSRWADDGECDDPRFEGEGAANTLLEEDRGHDAADCRALFESGRITLRTAAPSGTAGPSRRMEHRGRLEDGDATLTSGEFVDGYDFEGLPGQHVSIHLRSSDFDTYLILKDPSGEQTENDDAIEGNDSGHSNVEVELAEAGTYRVLVTSFESGESGSYELTIDISPNFERRPPPPSEITALNVAAHVTHRLGARRILLAR